MIETPIPGAAMPQGPTPQTAAWMPGQARPLSEEALKLWQTRVDRGETKAKRYHPQWKRGLTNYAEAIVAEAKTQVDALLDYRHVESKKSQLFHRTPEVTLLPVDPEDEAVKAAIGLLPVRQKFLNHELGPKAANAKRALHKTLIDTLAASGWMITEVGFEQVSLPDPVTGVSVPIWSRRFIAPVSSMKLIVPDDYYDSSDYDAAPWLAIKGVINVLAARRQGWYLPEEFTGTTQADEAIFPHDETKADASDPLAEYTKIWYRASLFDSDVFHPELYRCLILVKGCDHAAKHVDSPFQALDPQGQLTDDSMIGNPIHVGTLRDLPDSAYVPSDLCVGEQLSTELNKFRTDLVMNRRARRPIVLVSDAAGDKVAKKIIEDHAAVVPAQYIQSGGQQDLVALVQAGTEPRDNFTAQDIIERDQEEALGQGSNQRGQTTKRKTTATEARIVQGNSSARAETEKDRIRDYFIALVRKFDVVVQRTATVQELQKVLGAQGAMLWEQWRILPGTYAYNVLPDAGQWIDIHQARSEWLQKYELLRRDDRVNVDELLDEGARLWNRDPQKFKSPPVDKTTDPPKVSLSYSSVDLNDPIAGRVFLDLAANGGLKLSPDTIAMMKAVHGVVAAAKAAGMVMGADTPPNSHGGAALKAERLNKHQEERTGGVQGVGIQ